MTPCSLFCPHESLFASTPLTSKLLIAAVFAEHHRNNPGRKPKVEIPRSDITFYMTTLWGESPSSKNGPEDHRRLGCALTSEFCLHFSCATVVFLQAPPCQCLKGRAQRQQQPSITPPAVGQHRPFKPSFEHPGDFSHAPPALSASASFNGFGGGAACGAGVAGTVAGTVVSTTASGQVCVVGVVVVVVS